MALKTKVAVVKVEAEKRAAKHHSMNESSDSSTEGSIETILDQLFRFSRAIRRSGVARRFTRLSKFMEDKDSQANALSDEFERLVRQYFERKIEDQAYKALESSPLKERLIKTICLREQYFAYLNWQRGSKAEPQKRRTGYASRRTRPGASGSAVSPSKAETTTSGTTSNLPRGNRVMGATTLATNAQPVISEVGMDPHTEKLATDLPRRVVPSNKKIKDMECPYCYLVYPVREFSEDNWP